jgi:hypothetical protein
MGEFIEVLGPVVAGVFSSLILLLAIILVRYITRWADKLVDKAGNAGNSTELMKYFNELLQSEVRKAYDRGRKSREKQEEVSENPEPSNPPEDDVMRDFRMIAGGE